MSLPGQTLPIGRSEQSLVDSTTSRALYQTLSLGSRSHGVRILQVFAVCAMVFPSYLVLKPVGAEGYPAGLVGMFAFAAWAATSLLGLHDARGKRHPIRGVLCFLWVTTLVSYVLMDQGMMTPDQVRSGERFLMQLATISGVALVAAECLNSRRDIHRVVRVLSWGGAFCGLVAALQFWVNLDIAHYVESLPGFTLQYDVSVIIDRGGLNRVTGTAIQPIELGVTAAMMLPLALWSALYDTEQGARRRWIPVALIAASIAVSVSRSAIVGIAVSIGMFVVLMPARQRVIAFVALPAALGAVFMTAHGLLTTLVQFFAGAATDPSVTHRTDNYPYVEQLVRHAPWFGQGGGTYIPTPLHILDNEYLTTAISLGLVGMLALGALFFVPLAAALMARRQSRDPELRLLCAALASAVLAAGVCSATFDSLSFPMFYNVLALAIGLVGASWRLARAESDIPVREGRDKGGGLRRVEPFSGMRPVQVKGG